MKKIINKIGQVLQVILLAPVKLPGKALHIIKYIALGLGIVEKVLDDPDKKGEDESPPDESIVQQKEKEVPDEMEKFYRISLINSLIGFKPVNLLGSCNELYTDGFKAPFVKESTVRIGLEVREIMDIPLNGTTIVIGEIVQILLDDLIVEEDGTVDHVQAGSMAVAGLDRYFIPEFAGRLSYAKPGIKVEEINK